MYSYSREFMPSVGGLISPVSERKRVEGRPLGLRGRKALTLGLRGRKRAQTNRLYCLILPTAARFRSRPHPKRLSSVAERLK